MDPSSVEELLSLTNRETDQKTPMTTSWNEEFTSVLISFENLLEINSYFQLSLAPNAIAKDGGIVEDQINLKLKTIPYPALLAQMRIIEIAKTVYAMGRIDFATSMDYDTSKIESKSLQNQKKVSINTILITQHSHHLWS